MITQKRSTLDEANIHAEVGSRPWSLAITGKARTSLTSTDVSANYAWTTIDLSRFGEAWKTLGYESFDEYLESELGIDRKFFEKIGRTKSSTNRDGKTLYEIFRADRTAEAAQEAEREQSTGEGLKSHGGTKGNSNAKKDGKPEQAKNGVDNVNSESPSPESGDIGSAQNEGNNVTSVSTKEPRGNGTKYTLAKFQRDINNPDTSPERKAELQDLYDQIKSKEISVNAGAIAAGYRRKRTPLDTVKANLSKISMADLVGVLTDEQRSELATLLTPNTRTEEKADNKPTKTTAPKPRPKLDKRNIPKLLQHPGILGNWTEYEEGSEEQAKAVLRGLFFCFFRLDGSRDAWYRCKEVVEKVEPWKALGLKDFDEAVEAVFGMPLEQVESIEYLKPPETKEPEEEARVVLKPGAKQSDLVVEYFNSELQRAKTVAERADVLAECEKHGLELAT